MNRILANRRRKLLTDGSFFRLRRIRRAHQLPQIGNRIVLLQNHRKDWSARHELRQLAEERPRRVNMVKTLSLRLRNRKPLDGNDLKPRLFNLGENSTRVAFTNGVRLDNAECAL